MAQFAIVKNGIVTNIAVALEPLADTWIELSSNQECQIGWIHDFTDNTFRDPVVPPIEATPDIKVVSASNQLSTGSNGLTHVFTKGALTTITGTVQDVVAGVYNLPLHNYQTGVTKYAVFTVNPNHTYSFDFTVDYGAWYVDWVTFGTSDDGKGTLVTSYIVVDPLTNADLNLYLYGI